MTRQLIVQDWREIMFSKETTNIPLCCNIFFSYVDSKLRSTIPEYGEATIHDTVNGILLCPDCLIKKLRKTVEKERQP